MLSSFALSFAVALIATLFIVRSAHLHAGMSADNDLSGPQKFHTQPVPRIGGVGIFVGLLVGASFLLFKEPRLRHDVLALMFCALPAFASGLMEDITKRVSPLRRLLAICIGAALGVWLLGADINHTSIPGLDAIAATTIGAFLLALLVVAGVSNAINIIDGFNGLASMCCVVMLAGVAAVAMTVGDGLVASMAVLTLAATLGFFVWNYPMGLVFLGDGGAYFLGFMLAELSIMLINRNHSVSPLFPLLLCAYPVMETVFSMYRRRIVRGRPMGMPDGVHLHSLVYRRLMRWAIGSQDARVLTRRNSMTAPYLWVLCSAAAIPAVIWWDDTAMLAFLLVAFLIAYVSMYWMIVRFKTPRWLVVRR